MNSTDFSHFVTEGTYRRAAISTSYPLLLDIRPLDEYASKRIEPSLSIPFSFPVNVRSAKKAELWLMTLLLPEQPLVVICPQGRLADVAPRFWRCGFSAQLVSFVDAADIPVDLWKLEKLDRVRSQEDLKQLQIKTVLDCRTTYEFRNGSHINCLHLPLADLRRCGLHAIGVDLRPSEKSAVERDTVKVFHSALSAMQSQGLVIYCAGGYRSHIAVTLLRYFMVSSMAQEGLGGGGGGGASSVDASQAGKTNPSAASGFAISVSDLVGGALQLMQKRPDLWTLKDRSIICIS